MKAITIFCNNEGWQNKTKTHKKNPVKTYLY